jgi:hypothetical protein
MVCVNSFVIIPFSLHKDTPIQRLLKPFL